MALNIFFIFRTIKEQSPFIYARRYVTKAQKSFRLFRYLVYSPNFLSYTKETFLLTQKAVPLFSNLRFTTLLNVFTYLNKISESVYCSYLVYNYFFYMVYKIYILYLL